MLDNLLDAVIALDEAGMILSFNKSACKFFGYSVEEATSLHFTELIIYSDGEMFAGALAKYLVTGQSTKLGSTHEVSMRRKNGEYFPMRLSLSELPRSQDGRRMFVASGQDLTETKLQEEKLRQSQRMDALGKLTGGVAHDYNNMLGVILGYSEILLDALKGNPVLSNYTREIQRAGERGAELTQKLLAFSRKKQVESEPVDLNDLLEEHQLMLAKTLTARIELTMKLEPGLWSVNLDTGDFLDSILNLSINAMHAMESGGRLTFVTKNKRLSAAKAETIQLPEGEYVVLEITDTGVGMEDQIRSRVFEPFFSTKGELGTGLGLSQVYGFAERAGGAITVQSTPGQGSQFQFHFPRSKEQLEPLELKKSPSENIELRGTETILVVDDEPALRRLSQEVLERYGYKVLSADSAEQALHILARHGVDLVLSDVVMTGMDGCELAEIVQSTYPEIKVQLISGFSDGRHVSDTTNSLYPLRLSKPIKANNLLQRVRSLLNENKVERGQDKQNHKVNLPSSDAMKDQTGWNSGEMESGIAAIDQDHIELFKRLNALAGSIESKCGHDELDAEFAQTITLIALHLKREHAMVEASSYPNLNRLEKLSQFQKQHADKKFIEYNNGLITPEQFRCFLLEWLTDHISSVDPQVITYINKHSALAQQSIAGMTFPKA